MVTTSEALVQQADLLEKVASVILDLIQNANANARDRAEAEAKIAEFIAADEANAVTVGTGNTKLQELLNVATAAILPSSEDIAPPIAPPSVDGELG
ncbi:hypothetical protein [Anabaena lutea]|uniref:Uncharacterized protein n=1 Tax=Anabaena lutea FACHB-196 TaxID=2692881 RepID=A0ABR8FJH6_9NOST|nr:hypothetical protein [Anabaena lutea]MBD2570015.1 hypothetical protein [Anabaena lutea FACHB-196]